MLITNIFHVQYGAKVAIKNIKRFYLVIIVFKTRIPELAKKYKLKLQKFVVFVLVFKNNFQIGDEESNDA